MERNGNRGRLTLKQGGLGLPSLKCSCPQAIVSWLCACTHRDSELETEQRDMAQMCIGYWAFRRHIE